MEATSPYPPSTAYEILKGFFPDHALHTVQKSVAHPRSVVLRCNCGDDTLTIDETMAERFKWTMKEIRYALRNVT